MYIGETMKRKLNNKRTKFNMSTLQRLNAKQKVMRLERINRYYNENPCATINQAVIFVPEVAGLVCQYSKLRTELVREGDQDEITREDILNYVYDKNDRELPLYK